MENILNKFEKEIKAIVKNWDKITDDFKKNLMPNQYSNNISGVSKEGHIVILLLNRQKPSIYQSYDFDEERIGVNRFGEIIYGFDSGCSCPSPWNDSYPNCYNVQKTWKEFILKAKVADLSENKYQPDSFDSKELEKDIKERIDKILSLRDYKA